MSESRNVYRSRELKSAGWKRLSARGAQTWYAPDGDTSQSYSQAAAWQTLHPKLAKR